MTRQTQTYSNGGARGETEGDGDCATNAEEEMTMQQQQQRAQVLDSSDEESDDDSEIHDIRAVYSPTTSTIRPSPNRTGQNNRQGNSQKNSRFNDHSSDATIANADNNAANNDVETDTDDDEIMNPYVMNPFHSLAASRRSHMLDSALMPPSMELSNLSSQQQTRPPSQQPSQQPPQQQLQQPFHQNQSEQRQPQSLSTFDPYSPRVKVQQLRKQQLNHELTSHQNQLEFEMEMEEESIDFLYDAKTREAHTANNVNKVGGSTSSRNGEDEWQRDFSLFENPQSSILESQSEYRKYGQSTQHPQQRNTHQQHPQQHGQNNYKEQNPPSFSPFPKHKTASEYGESTPLSGHPSIHPFASQSEPRVGGVMGLAETIGGAMVTVTKAVVSSVSQAASSMARRSTNSNNSPNSSPRYGNTTHNPFAQSKLRGRSTALRNHWGILSYFRLFVIVMAALFAVGTMTMVRHAMSSSNTNGTNGSMVTKSLYGGESSTTQETFVEYNTQDGVAVRKPSSLMKKMETAKKKAKGKHWWNQFRHGGKEETKVVQPPLEVYRNGEKETVVVSDGSSPSLIGDANETENKDKVDGNGNAEGTLPVIVTTGEDGTILIKLPPPKMHLEESRPSSMTLSSAAPMNSVVIKDLQESSSPLQKNEEDETVFIKLPYQPERRRTLTDIPPTSKEELDPPLRRGSIPSGHSNLHRRPPPPLSEPLHAHHDHYTNHNNKKGKTHGKHHLGYFEHEEHHSGVLDALRNEFDSWMENHEKKYGSHEEKEHRFHVWKKNHFRITEKNQKHGPCRMTGKAVFGHNIFSDLDPGEFEERFLTGYRGPRAHDAQDEKTAHSHFREGASHPKARKSGEVYPPPMASVKRHPNIQRKLEQHVEQQEFSHLHGYRYKASFANGCKWWDVSCVLRWVFGYQYVGGTREPVYDESSYPSALDWRSMGVVTQVHSQGSCGACWAITAVETIESAYAISTGTLINLSEHEVIACDGSCEMCNGGWPQNAYEYAMKHGGLPEQSSSYDADWLYAVTAVLAGESDEVSEYELSSYFAKTCPSGYREGSNDNGGDSHDSQHSGDNDSGSYSSSTRYGNIKGYGYATDRCVCYTDGSGCDCDSQDEKTAVLNVASYGPAAVCLEASLWQDYEGGIMTSDIGCSSQFLDMNHCVQVVGYAFTDGTNNEEENSGQSGSNDKSNKSGSNDQREGYWIVRNQWSNYWGMNGYAYLAMGDNTCGILNDMTQVYMD